MIAEFADFARREIADGGPEPELAPIVWLTRDSSDVEKVWAAGVYCAHHCVPSAMAVWRKWRPEALIVAYDLGVLDEWLEEHWSALPVRNEMRSHRMPAKRAECLRDFAVYAIAESWRTGTYDEVWDDSIDQVKYFGRYVAVKYLEFLRRMVRPDLVLTDVRIAKGSGAWSVREGLARIYPEMTSLTNRADTSKDTMELAEAAASQLIQSLREQDLVISHFDAQVLLCEFKQWSRGTFYPGVSHDEEMEFARIVETQFAIPEFWEARRTLFPHSALGEIGGWEGRREEKYKEKE